LFNYLPRDSYIKRKLNTSGHDRKSARAALIAAVNTNETDVM